MVYGGTGRAARSWEAYHAIVASLKNLENDETLLVQSGKPVGVFKTHEYAPRVLIANSNLVGHWSNWEKFNELERAGLMMYGQMTAGSWIYIGSQGIMQGTFETFSAAGEKHFGGDLAGKLIVSGGMGGMGGAQPLAATMTGAAFLGIDVDAERIKKRLKTGYCDFMVTTLDEALRILKNAVRKKENVSVGLVGNCADIIPELAERGVLPDILTDQTSAHDPLNGYVPNGMTLARSLGVAAARSQGLSGTIAGCDGPSRRRHAAPAEDGCGDVRLRKQHPHICFSARREECLRLSRVCPGVHPAAVLRGTRAVSLGRAVGRSLGHCGHRRSGAGTVSRKPDPAPLD